MSNNSLVCNVVTSQNIALASDLLRKGSLVAFPTETVYGIGGAAHQDEAMLAIYRTKGRPSNNPLIVHVADKDMASRYGMLNDMALDLIDTYWPGPLTIVVPVKERSVSSYALAGGTTVALRCPAHPAAQQLLTAFGQGIAAPSANKSGHVSPTSAAHVFAEFRDDPQALRLILDGGSTEIGLESTVIDCTGTTPHILRPGSIMVDGCNTHVLTASSESLTIKSPGQLSSHYAPNATVILNVSGGAQGAGLLTFGDISEVEGVVMRHLSIAADVDEAAHNLYAYMRELDALGLEKIGVMPIPHEGVGVAINDRLKRAAAKR